MSGLDSGSTVVEFWELSVPVPDADREDGPLEAEIARWRSYLRRRQAIHAVDVDELEDHLRGQVAALVDAGLATDEAFLVAVKRMGDLNELSREFAREHSGRLWKQLVVAPGATASYEDTGRKEAIIVVGLALLSALAVKVPVLFGRELFGSSAGFYARNVSLFVLPFLTVYFAWKPGLDAVSLRWPSPLPPSLRTSSR